VATLILGGMWQTAGDSEGSDHPSDVPVPGLLLVFHGVRPILRAEPIGEEGLVVGRELFDGSEEDDRLSRRHAEVKVERGRFVVVDLGSRNGTYIDGKKLGERGAATSPPAVLRTGRTLGVLLPDVRKFLDKSVEVGEHGVIGPTLAACWAAVARAGRHGEPLLLTGESGTGKELAARAYHRATGRGGELIAVNCAAIPESVAERLLFGAKRGAFSGADKDADGYLSAADGGTLFLDEIGDLPLPVQAKLLRALDAKEILPVGAPRPRPIDVRVVSATLRDLVEEVVAGRFRNDLFHRIGQPEVTLPPLRHRVDDLVYLVTETIERAVPGMQAHPTFIEACLMRRWNGNVREMVGQVRRAAIEAHEAGETQVRSSLTFTGEDRFTHHGYFPLPSMSSALRDDAKHAGAAVAAAVAPRPLPPHEQIEQALRAESGNVTRAAKALGLHRNQLRRYMVRHPELDALAAGGGKDAGDAGDAPDAPDAPDASDDVGN
jgi:DNA-binding NtrC family response regulator